MIQWEIKLERRQLWKRIIVAFTNFASPSPYVTQKDDSRFQICMQIFPPVEVSESKIGPLS